MKYTLAFLTCVGREQLAADTLASFLTQASPRPSALVTVVDGKTSAVGFCRASGALWEVARGRALPWTFWLEDDFLLTRPIDLTALAQVMEENERVAQVALCRQACNESELKAGGLVEARPETFEARDGWLEQSAYFTTNPSLIRGSILEHAWPDPPHCEGKMTFALRESRPGTTFGLWGAGEPWVEHVGVRTGFGY